MVIVVSDINPLVVGSLEIRALSKRATARAPPFPHTARRRSKNSLRNGCSQYVRVVIVQIFGRESLLPSLFPKMLMVRIYKPCFIFRLYGLEMWRLPSKEWQELQISWNKDPENIVYCPAQDGWNIQDNAEGGTFWIIALTIHSVVRAMRFGWIWVKKWSSYKFSAFIGGGDGAK